MDRPTSAGGVRSYLRYLRRWLTVAFGHSWTIYERLSGVLMVVLFVVGRFIPVPESASVMVTWAAIIIFMALVAFRMAVAPYWISEEEKARSDAEESRLKQQLFTEEKRRTLANALGTFLAEGAKVLKLCVQQSGSGEVEKIANDWYQRATAFISQYLGSSYVERFKDPPLYTDQPIPYPADRLGLYYGIRGRVSRLHEFLKEIQPPPGA